MSTSFVGEGNIGFAPGGRLAPIRSPEASLRSPRWLQTIDASCGNCPFDGHESAPMPSGFFVARLIRRSHAVTHPTNCPSTRRLHCRIQKPRMKISPAGRRISRWRASARSP